MTMGIKLLIKFPLTKKKHMSQGQMIIATFDTVFEPKQEYISSKFTLKLKLVCTVYLGFGRTRKWLLRTTI